MLSLTSQCGICGQPLLSSDLTSDPSQHFCGLELNGAASAHLAPSTPHNPLDLAEIGRLYMKNTALKGMQIPTLITPSMSKTSSTPRYTPVVASQRVMTREVAMVNGERVMVEVAVHAK
ncbi:hypothetical protein B0A55_11582 [Friedmanniomyces simplex]|uniref:Uncharacterized protein n=1 Tax=Friedmanniomyces simplex TaxID=329884 RepID=A0A4U0WC10_9PEZI|nr:hypothetical protein B0A55_11582 [Friedmanniomyces simplex]